jgi:phosphorylase kinase alpha/beta subunit
VVTAALRMLRLTMERLKLEDSWKFGARKVDVSLVDGLISKGLRTLAKILPHECVQRGLSRRYDAALLFLIYPMDVVSRQMADQILEDVTGHLQGDYGIRRYRGDSYWAADYKERLSAQKRSMRYHLDSLQRNELFKGAEEAQWCLFDPIVSIIYGRKYRQQRKRRDLELQTAYVNRSLGQITAAGDHGGPYQCPELYYSRGGRYVTNENTPLLWTQANLWVALQCLIDNLA